MDYRTLEHLGAAWFSARGFRISYPASDVRGYDFIVHDSNDPESTPIRVNVKQGRRRFKKWNFSTTPNFNWRSCDQFLIWCFEYSFLLISVSSVANMKGRRHSTTGDPEPIFYSER